jgi:hypothetical protein
MVQKIARYTPTYKELVGAYIISSIWAYKPLCLCWYKGRKLECGKKMLFMNFARKKGRVRCPAGYWFYSKFRSMDSLLQSLQTSKTQFVLIMQMQFFALQKNITFGSAKEQNGPA